MNYYSRSSPQRRKKNPPPGFLIPSKASPAPKPKPKDTFRSKFVNSSNPPQKQIEQSSQHQENAPVSHRQSVYTHSNNQILILQQQDQQQSYRQQKISQQLSDQVSQDQEFEQYKPLANLEVSKFRQTIQTQKMKLSNNYQLKKIQETKRIKQQQLKIQDQKIFFRNYSFGDKQFNIQSYKQRQFRKQPLIKSIINVHITKHQQFKNQDIQFSNKKSLKSSKLSIKKNEQSPIKKIQKWQNWDSLVQKFIKKRLNGQKFQSFLQNNKNIKNSSSNYNQKQQQNNKQLKKSTYKQNNQRQKSSFENYSTFFQQDNAINDFKDENGEVITNIQGVYDQFQTLSQQSAYFRPQNIYSVQQMNLFEQNRFNVHQNKNLKSFQKSNDFIHIQESQKSDKKSAKEVQLQNIGFKNSIKSLEQSIKYLPSSLVPRYQKIYQQLIRKEYENQVTIKRMQQTQKMIRMLIELQKKSINSVNFIISNFPDQKSQRIAANIQIISSLVRKLAQFF